MDSLQQIIGTKKFSPPDELSAIKDYVQQKYKSDCGVKFQNGAVIVSVPNSALAATLQLERPKIIKACDLGDLKLVIRNGK